ncbi:Transferrin receptor-like, PAG-like [Trypanosoma congolense IL3000]|uniref:Transferrin receptor-like, PAG-like n=1 Tax=Trypanosoma congolense (strain IL3000) TaxID=1068625 RepID=F9WIK7_TRYCI|nr:Transferrin receptor-like, PAG-like [Trypanosoma congolense IL3000]
MCGRFIFFVVVVSLVGVVMVEARDLPALKLESAQGACAVSRLMKSMYNFVSSRNKEAQEMYESVERMYDLGRVRIAQHVLENGECDRMTFFVLFSQRIKENMTRKIRGLASAGVKLVGAAGLAAGRLDEFINIFRHSWHVQTTHIYSTTYNHTYSFCLRGKGTKPVDKKSIVDCFMNDKETDDNGFVPVDGGDVHWLDQEDMGSLLDMRLKLVDGDPRDEHGQNRSCMLLSMDGNDGYLGKGNNGKKVLWADGLLGVTSGNKKKSGFTGSVRSSSYSTNIMWEAKPSSSIPVLKDFVVRYNDYRKLFDEVKHLSAAMTDDWTVDHLMKYAEGIASLLYKPEELDVLLSVDENEGNETAEEDQRRLRLRHTVEPFVGLNDRKQEWLAQYNKELVSKEFLAAEIQLCRSAAELHLRRNRWFFEW